VLSEFFRSIEVVCRLFMRAEQIWGLFYAKVTKKF
jgi:hypothetical protein